MAAKNVAALTHECRAGAERQPGREGNPNLRPGKGEGRERDSQSVEPIRQIRLLEWRVSQTDVLRQTPAQRSCARSAGLGAGTPHSLHGRAMASDAAKASLGANNAHGDSNPIHSRYHDKLRDHVDARDRSRLRARAIAPRTGKAIGNAYRTWQQLYACDQDRVRGCQSQPSDFCLLVSFPARELEELPSGFRPTATAAAKKRRSDCAGALRTTFRVEKRVDQQTPRNLGIAMGHPAQPL